MHLIFEILWTLAQAIYFWIEGIIFALIPPSLAKRKNVSGEKVFITGAGKLLYDYGKTLNFCNFVYTLQSDPLNSSFSFNSSGKFESVVIDPSVKLPS